MGVNRLWRHRAQARCARVARYTVWRAYRRQPSPIRLGSVVCRGLRRKEVVCRVARPAGDDELDAAYIATPVHLHAAQAIAAAEAGKHVLCEKPMAMNVQECDRMIDAARSHGVKLGVAYYRRFYPVVERVKEIIGSGEIGVPSLAQVEAFEWFNPADDDPRSWLLQEQLAGGGPMFDCGCHRIEVLLDIFGPISEVKALIANTIFDRELEDTASALFRFAGGACAVLSVSHAVAEAKDTLNIFGSLGSIRVSVLNQGKLRVMGKLGERHETHSPPANLHAPLIEDFTTAVLRNREPRVSGETGRRVAVIEEEIYRQANARDLSCNPEKL